MDRIADTDHPVHDLIARRWSPRSFADRPVDPGDLRSLLEAARWAASSFNEQPWFFLVARRDDPQAFERMLGCLVDGNRTWAKNAAVLMLGVLRNEFVKNGKPNRHAAHDLGLAMGNLSLQATDLGLVVHQMGGILPDVAAEFYGVPEGFTVLTGIAIGYQGDPETLPEGWIRDGEIAPRSRRPQAEFVFEGRWNDPAAF